MRPQDSHRAGFTLLELMVTVAIIGILAAIAVPAFQSYQQRTKRSEAMSNVASISRMEQGYFAEFSGHVRVILSQPGPLAGGLGPAQRPWTSDADEAFAQLGWRPEGSVYFDYEVNTDEDGTCRGCFTVTAYGDVDGDQQLSMVQFVQPTADLAAHLPSVIEPGLDIPTRHDGTPLYLSAARNEASDNF